MYRPHIPTVPAEARGGLRSPGTGLEPFSQPVQQRVGVLATVLML